MDYKNKRSLALVLSITALCSPIRSSSVLSGISPSSVVASASGYVMDSGSIYDAFHYDRSSQGFILLYYSQGQKSPLSQYSHISSSDIKAYQDFLL